MKTLKKLAGFVGVCIVATMVTWSVPMATGIIIGAGCQGCTTSQQAVAYKSLYILASSVDAGMKAFADAVVTGKVPQATQDKAKDLHGRYAKAMQAAVLAAHFDTSAPAPENLKALASELLALITEAVK